MNSFDLDNIKVKKTKFKINESLIPLVLEFITKSYKPLLLGEISLHFDFSLAYTELYIEHFMKRNQITIVYEHGYKKYWHL